MKRIDYKNYKINQVENLIKKTPGENEVGFVFDRSGKFLEGSIRGVNGKPQIDVGNLDLEGKIMTHNHPVEDISLVNIAQDPTWQINTLSDA